MRTRPRRIPARRSRRQRSLQSARYHLALMTIVLFASVCLGLLLTQSNTLFEKLLPFVMPPVTLVLNYYFGRRERE